MASPVSAAAETPNVPVPQARPSYPIPEPAPVETPPSNKALGAEDDAASRKAAAPGSKASADSADAFKGRLPDITPAASVAAAAAVEDATACEAELTRRGVKFSVGESISDGECGVLRPIALERLSAGIVVTPKTVMLCRAALALDVWMSDSILPAAKTGFPAETMTDLRHASTYVCRARASESGISEHARGSAIDIAGFVFGKGRTIGLEERDADSPEAIFQARIRAAACGPFKTVLGPGTDADHATHLHLDIAARRNGATYCR